MVFSSWAEDACYVKRHYRSWVGSRYDCAVGDDMLEQFACAAYKAADAYPATKGGECVGVVYAQPHSESGGEFVESAYINLCGDSVTAAE